MKTNGILIAPIIAEYSKEQISSVKTWNSKNDLDFQMVSSNQKLSGIDLNALPQFYFFKDGKLVKKLSGWPNDNSQIAVIEQTIIELKR